MKAFLLKSMWSAMITLPIAATIAVAAPARADEPKALPGADTQFLAKAIVSGADEIEISQLAAQKASNADVKGFAEQMVKDHTAVNKKLQDEAALHALSTKGNYGTPPLEADKQGKAAKEKLQSLSGREFDSAYLKKMIADHHDALALFQEEATNGKDTQMRNLADATIPALKEHLKHAETLTGKSGG